MIDVAVSYTLEGEQKESIVTFGCATYEIITGEYKGLSAEELTDLYKRRSREEWYKHFYYYAMKRCWKIWFEWGFIPKDLTPKRFIPASSIISATFPDGWILYREMKQDKIQFSLCTLKEFLERIKHDVNEIGNQESQPKP